MGFINKFCIDYFRKFKKSGNKYDCDFKLGSRITVISGVNGVGKSSLLSLIASTTGTKEKRLNGTNFHPEFNEFFKISPKEDFKNYRMLVDFDYKGQTFTKRIGFKDDTESGRGIRPIPRTGVPRGSKVKVEEAGRELKEKLDIGKDQRVPIPTIYLSLSRLYPIGEHGATLKNKYSRINRNSKIIKNKLNKMYFKFYNAVLPGSIDSENNGMVFVTKGVTKKSYLKMHLNNTTNETISVGEDNLSAIISSLIDFYNLKLQNGKNYIGGILCIDEIDASLHASAVIKLFTLLKILSDKNKLNLQIILTSHSLTVLKQILKLQKKHPKDYRLVYFKDRNIPAPANFDDYASLRANLYDKVCFHYPKVKIYTEDDFTANTLEALIMAFNNITAAQNNQTVLPKYELIPMYLGKDQLRRLPSLDNEIFKKAVILLDGDGHLNCELDISKAYKGNNLDLDYLNGLDKKDKKQFNEVSLPGFLPPELFLFNIIKEYANNPLTYNDFWRNLRSYTSDQVQNLFKTNCTQIDTDFFKKFLKGQKHEGSKELGKTQKEIIKFVNTTDILTDYYSQQNNKDELFAFINDFSKKVIKASEIIKSDMI